ncbi:membrane transport protein [Salmonella bongori]|nr:membrane transport protein [Salmonella bongori]
MLTHSITAGCSGIQYIIGVMGLSSINRRLVQRHPLHTLLRVAALVCRSGKTVVLAAGAKMQTGGMAMMVVTIFYLFLP